MTAYNLPFRGIPLNPRTALSDLIARFMPAFSKAFSSPFASPGAVAISWWLSGGIAAANCIAAYDAKNAASYAASLKNLANAALPITEGKAPAWSAGAGWIGDGATNSRYLKTGIIPVVDQTWSMILRMSGHTSAVGYWAGSVGANGRFYLADPGGLFGYGNGGQVFGSAIATSGIVAIIGNKGYLNGNQDVTSIAPGVGNGIEIYILCRNNLGTAANFANTTVAALAIYNINILSYFAALNVAVAAL